MNKNKTPHLPEDLEKELQDYYASPEPQPEFVSRLERGLHSKFNEQEKTKMFAKSAKFKWGLGFAIAAVLIGLLVTSPTVVTAMKRLFGYIPGVGLVDSSSPFRVLAEPVSQTRDGVTVTVKEALLSADKATIVYTLENIPFEMLSSNAASPSCGGGAKLRLPDGSILQQTSGSGSGWGTGMEMRFAYTPIPSDVNEATFVLPCIQDVTPGALPENWELPLRFIPAPPEMTLVPVIEVTPQETGAAADNPLILEKVIETEAGYILIGRFDSSVLNTEVTAMGMSEGPSITDANGNQVQFTAPNDVDNTSYEMGVFPWAYQLNAKQFAWPLTIILKAVDSPASGAETSLDFDTGPNPQPGQEWKLDQPLQLGEYTVILNTIQFNGDGYNFNFQSEDGDNVGPSVEIAGFQAAGGGGGSDGTGSMTSSMQYEGEAPVGKLKLIFYSNPIVQIHGPWQLEWQPENASLLPAPAPTETLDACLTLDAWTAALANPQPIPADLTGKLSIYGRINEDGQNQSADNYGTYIFDFGTNSKQIVGPGTWPSLSPDGTQVAYGWDDGLHLFDLASGMDSRIPTSQKNDNLPRWSPDGKQIAFTRGDDFNLYIMNADGSGVQRVFDDIDYEELLGWSVDGMSLFYGTNTQQGVMLNQVEIASGQTHELFPVMSSGMEVSLSPDGTRFAFVAQLGNTSSIDVYTAALDGSDRKLITQMGSWMAFRPVWSPDGNWLVMGVFNTGISNSETQLAAVNLQTCQIVPLPLSGDVSSWVR